MAASNIRKTKKMVKPRRRKKHANAPPARLLPPTARMIQRTSAAPPPSPARREQPSLKLKMSVQPARRRRWPRLLTKLEARRLSQVLNEVWRDHAATATHLEVNFVDENTIAELHRDFLQDASPTDVITFDLGVTPSSERIAVIAICVPVAARYAGRFNVPLAEELQRLIIHGALHLLGFDDHSAVEKRRMRYHENKAIQRVRKTARRQ
jgi:rRNA maturation RNase YbeY